MKMCMSAGVGVGVGADMGVNVDAGVVQDVLSYAAAWARAWWSVNVRVVASAMHAYATEQMVWCSVNVKNMR